MSRPAKKPARLAKFLRREDGGPTIEFILFLPFFMMLFLSAFEMGMLLARNVMLDRGLDIAVRDVRLGVLQPLTEDTMKERACEAAVMIPDCENQIRLEMLPLNPRAFTNIPAAADCKDRGKPDEPLRQFVAGISNELVIVRACVLFDPYTPLAALGKIFADAREDGTYALVSTAAYVVEP